MLFPSNVKIEHPNNETSCFLCVFADWNASKRFTMILSFTYKYNNWSAWFLYCGIRNNFNLFFFSEVDVDSFSYIKTTGLRPKLKMFFCFQKKSRISLFFVHLLNLNTHWLSSCGCWQTCLRTNMQQIVSVGGQTEICTLEWLFSACVCVSGYRSRL